MPSLHGQTNQHHLWTTIFVQSVFHFGREQGKFLPFQHDLSLLISYRKGSN